MSVPIVRPVAIVTAAVPWLATETTPCCGPYLGEDDIVRFVDRLVKAQ